jgi:hypothetical protein
MEGGIIYSMTFLFVSEQKNTSRCSLMGVKACLEVEKSEIFSLPKSIMQMRVS